MFSRQGRTSLQDTLRYCAVFCLSLIAMLLSNALAISRVKPSRGDFALCELSAEDKDKFLDEHNKFRGMVDPTAADMEYLFWDEDLANLAKMWSNQCIWDHGFVQFGDEYPNGTPYKGQVGQNLARQWGELPSPEDRVKPWYNENQYYAYSKYANPMGSACARGKICGHYTQLAWAKTKFVGCGVKWCDKEFDTPHPWVPGETIVTCDYALGNIIGQYPYKKGTPCSKCASGNGFCYKNLCRDCKNFDSECGKSLLKEMCSTDRDKMAKKCPKMCNLCECPLKCQNGGTVNLQNCVCNCPSGWKGLDCSEKECLPGFYGENCKNRCYDAAGKDTCEWRVRNGHDCQAYYMEIDCALTCGYCDDGSKRTTTTPAPVITTVPTPPLMTTLPTTPTTTGMQNLPMPSSPAECKTADLNSSCGMWAAKGECEKNPRWMIPNCCASCKHHRVLKDCSDSSSSCPRWAYKGECEKNRKWMQNNCRKSCNQCGDCKDTDPKCPSWALLKQCSSGDRATWMNTNCRRSCGMCRVYDKHVECPAWSVMEDCNTNYWMRDHCPRSCDVPFSEASFCGGKSDGNYQFPKTCLAYTACSHGVTSHVHCQAGMKFDTVKRICEPEDQATCTVVCP